MKANTTFTRWARRIQPVVLLLLSLLGLLRLETRMPLALNIYVSAGLRQFTPSLEKGLVYSVELVLLYAVYLWLAWLVRRGRWRPPLIAVLGITLLLALPTLLTYPFNANDIFRYALRGRITVFHGGNPFLDLPSAYPDEPLLPMTGQWASTTSPYGPLWELIAGGVALAAGERPFTQILFFKALMIGAHLAITWLIWLVQADKSGEERLWLAALWGWNPSLLLIFGADGHNDALMLLWLVAGWAVLRRGLARRAVAPSAAGLLLMTLGFLTKAIGLLPLPFFGLSALRRFDRPGERGRLLALGVAGGGLLAALAFLPFGSPLLLLTRLLKEAGDGASYSLPALLVLQAEARGLAIDLNALSRLFYGSLMLVLLGLLWLTWRGRSPQRSAADALFAYIGLAFNFRLWYAAWPLPFVLLDERIDRPRLAAALCFLLTSQLSVFFYSHLWFYEFNRNDLLTHRWGVTFVFGLPLVVYWLSRWRTGLRDTHLNS